MPASSSPSPNANLTSNGPPPWRTVAVVLIALAFIAAACSVKNPDTFDESIEIDATPTPTPTATPVPDLPPEITAPNLIRAQVGDTVPVTFLVTDDKGDPVSGLEDLAPGMVLAEDADGSRYTWKPSEAGSWLSTIRAFDSAGQETTHQVLFVARYPKNEAFVVAMGDSIPAGHGLEVSDYVTGDDCFRADNGYPSRVVSGLMERDWLPEQSRVAVVACTGTKAEDLSTKLFTGGFAETVPNGTNKLTQVEWAVRANPALILITVGINDVGFIDPERFFKQDNTVNRVPIAEGVHSLEQGLSEALDRLLATTDAMIVVTEYYNPTAPNPQGFDGCRTECFRAGTEGVVTEINASLAEVVADYDPRRVTLVELQQLFDGHGAPNGLGPDGLRDGSLGVLGDWAEGYLGGIQPFCARGDTQGEPWINNIDCVHPTEQGAQQIADVIVEALAG